MCKDILQAPLYGFEPMFYQTLPRKYLVRRQWLHPRLNMQIKSNIFIPSVIYGYRSRLDGTSSSQRSINDAPTAMNYLSQICECRDLLIFSVFRTINDAILRLPYDEISRINSIKKYLDKPETIKLLTRIKLIIRITDIKLFTRRQRIYYIAFFLICHGYIKSGLTIYTANTFKSKFLNKFHFK